MYRKNNKPKAKRVKPNDNIPVFIRPGLTVYTDDNSKVEGIKERYKNK